MDDLDLNLSDFVARVNSDLVGKFVNIASRCAKLLETHFGNTPWTAASGTLPEGVLAQRSTLLDAVAGHTHASPPRCTPRTTSPRWRETP